MSRKRLKEIIVYGLAILLAGFVYGVFIKYTGWGLPCPVYTLTGLQCPGCGITHMCMALFRMDFKKAYLAHPMLFLLLPVLLWILLRNAIRYVRNGRWQLTKAESAVIYICILLLLGFSVVRNAEDLREILERL